MSVSRIELATAVLIIIVISTVASTFNLISTRAFIGNSGSIARNGYVIYKDGVWTKAMKIAASDAEFSDTDSSKVINAAIENLTDGGMIFVSEGTYVLSATIYLASNILFRGAGIDATLLKLQDNATSPPGDMLRGGRLPYELHDRVNNVSILDLTLDGNKANNPYQGIWNRQNPIYFQWSSNITIERVRIYNGTAVDVHLDSCANVVLRNLYLYSAGWDGIHLGNMDDKGVYTNRNVTIEDVYLENFTGYPSNKHYHGWTGGSGIDVGKSTHVEIRRVEVVDTGAKGIYFDGVTDGVIEDCRVENTNMIERSGAYSIYHSVNVRVINSTSRRSGCIGVEAVKLLRGTISTNTVLEPRLSGITLWRSGQTLVSENVLNKTEASNYGIRVAGLEYNEIKLNVVIGFSEPISIRYLQ